MLPEVVPPAPGPYAGGPALSAIALLLAAFEVGEAIIACIDIGGVSSTRPQFS